MKRNSFLILSALVMLFAACGKKGGKSGLLVPKDAALVVHINSSSLSSKLSWDEIRQTSWFSELSQKETDTMAQQLLADPASSGIDIKADLVFFAKKQGRGGYLVFEGSLNDAAAFEKLLNEIHKKNPKEVKKDEDFSYIESEGHGVVLWNKSRFAYIANAPFLVTNPVMGNRRSSRNYDFLNDSLRIFGKGALTLKSSDNLDTDSRFADLVKEESDVHLWSNMPVDFDGLGLTGITSMLKLEVLVEGNVSAMSINFDNGKITAKSKTYYNDQMSKLLAEHKPGPLSADMINRIPSSNVAGVIAFNYPPKGLQALLKLINADGYVNAFLGKMNYSVEEFVKANKGDVLIAVTDLAMVAKQDTINYGNGTKPFVYTTRKPDMNVLFATSVNDKAAFEKMITIAWEAAKGQTGKLPPISYKLENNWFAASNSAEYTDKFLAGGNNKQPFVDKIAGHPMGMYVDLNKIISGVAGAGTTAPDSLEKASMDLTLAMWRDIVAYGGEFKDKAVSFDMEVNLGDKNTNSLKQINQYMDKMHQLHKKRKEKFASQSLEESMKQLEDAGLMPPGVESR